MAPIDLEKTAPFELGRGDDAALLIHGFTGSPWDMRPLGDALAARGLFVRGIRLPGHGTTPEAMAQVTYRDWEQAAEDALLALGNFRRVFVGGLSMGALLGMLLASRHPQRVQGLALVAPALRFLGPTMGLLRATRGVPWLEWVKPWIAKTGTDIGDPQVLAEAPLLPRFPSARLRDLWTIQERAAAVVPTVTCPTLIAVSAQDHVVDPASGRALVKQLTGAPSVDFLQINQGFHIIPRDAGGPVLAREVGAFFDRLRQ